MAVDYVNDNPPYRSNDDLFSTHRFEKKIREIYYNRVTGMYTEMSPVYLQPKLAYQLISY